MRHNFSGVPTDSFMVVRRNGIRQSPNGRVAQNDPLEARATERAHALAALISLVLLAQSNDWKTAGLAEYVHKAATRRLTMMCFESGEFTFSVSGAGGFARYENKPFVFTRGCLREILTGSDVKGFYRIVQSTKKVVPTALRRSVIQASKRLAEAIHEPNPAGILVGSVTAIEILLSRDGTERFSETINRLIALIGKQAFEDLQGSLVFTERHAYVHQGKQPSDNGEFASALALLALLRYCDLALSLQSKDVIVDFLNYISAAQSLRLSSSLSVPSEIAGVAHRPVGHNFPYFHEETRKRREVRLIKGVEPGSGRIAD